MKKRLEDVFQTSADMETKMAEFEQRIQPVTESEDKFMLSLVKLHRTANPTASTADINRAISDSARSAKSPILFAERCRIARRKSSFDTLDRFQRLVGTPIQKLSFPIVTASLLLIFCMFTRDGCQNKMECRKLVCDKYFDCPEA